LSAPPGASWLRPPWQRHPSRHRTPWHHRPSRRQPARAIEVLEASLRLDPFQPFLFAFGHIGLANYMLKRYGESVRLCRECVLRLPNQQWPHLMLAAAYAQWGQLEEARAEAAEVLRINPRFTIERYKRILVYKDPKDVEHRIHGLRKAGLRRTCAWRRVTRSLEPSAEHQGRGVPVDERHASCRCPA
jgi:tetratricopeptide (TPR) repeat protein